eukprot:1829175-Heterocapsa_arctica.AAC.1
MSVMFIVLDPRFGDWFYWILYWKLGIALSQIEDEVHFDSYLRCLVPGERPEVHFDWLFKVFGARRAPRGPL